MPTVTTAKILRLFRSSLRLLPHADCIQMLLVSRKFRLVGILLGKLGEYFKFPCSVKHVLRSLECFVHKLCSI